MLDSQLSKTVCISRIIIHIMLKHLYNICEILKISFLFSPSIFNFNVLFSVILQKAANMEVALFEFHGLMVPLFFLLIHSAGFHALLCWFSRHVLFQMKSPFQIDHGLIHCQTMRWKIIIF
jgi:hypothetical protein